MISESTHTVPIASLKPADSPRLAGEDAEHIRLLAESDKALPPILVHRGSRRVIDGMHRLGAARLRGQDSIEVRFFEGSDAEAFVLAVKANVAHGLPLSFADREAAAARIVASHPSWSDRAIAAQTGLGPRTVGTVRRRTGMATAGGPGAARVGRDGRVRPLDGADGRLAASRLIAEDPNVSLREIARAAGISPTTARDVRQRLRRGEDPVTPRQRGHRGSSDATREEPRRDRGDVSQVLVADRATVLQNLKNDPSLRFSESGRTLLRWLFARTVDPGEWRDFVAVTPPHCAYVIAGVARACAAEWLEFAKQLEQRVRTQPGSPEVA